MFIKNLLKNNYLKIFFLFLIWRFSLFFVAFLASQTVPFSFRFPYVDRVLEPTRLPAWLWGWGNFDGVHYLRIAQNGYSSGYSQAFFPLFPLLIRFLANLLPRFSDLDLAIYVDPKYFWAGWFLPQLFFVLGLAFFYKLLRLDFNKKVSWSTLIFLLVFPTSYYFGAIYTESLFLFLAVLAIWLLRRKKYLWSGLIIALASATRVVGVLLGVVYLIEVWDVLKKNHWQARIGLLLIPLGLILYMVQLFYVFGDPLYFLHVQPLFGAERSSELILLPRVFYRYFKIFLSVSPISLAFMNAALEMLFTCVFLAILIFKFKKIRFSYWCFSLIALLLPTLTGTLSSMPRYVLMCFLIFPFLIARLSQKKLTALYVFLAVFQLVLAGLFVRGYWIA